MSDYNELLGEMLNLAGIPINEQDNEAEVDTEIELDKDEVKKYSTGSNKTDKDSDKKKKKDDEKDSDEELVDQWDSSIDSTGKVEVEFHESSVTVKFKDRESSSIEIPSTLRNDVEKVSKLFNKIMTHIERVS